MNKVGEREGEFGRERGEFKSGTARVRAKLKLATGAGGKGGMEGREGNFGI